MRMRDWKKIGEKESQYLSESNTKIYGLKNL